MLRTSLLRRLVGFFPNQVKPFRGARHVQENIWSPMERIRLPGVERTFVASVLLSVVLSRAMGNSSDSLRKTAGNTSEKTEKISEKPIQPRVQYSEEQLRERLTEEEYDVTQNKGTESAFSGRYWNVKEDGTYTCVVCGEELFKSDTKFDSGTGWPSFTDVASKGKVSKIADNSYGMLRVEVVCTNCGAHLGHVFDDGPGLTKERYCINSCSLKFNKQEK